VAEREGYCLLSTDFHFTKVSCMPLIYVGLQPGISIPYADAAQHKASQAASTNILGDNRCRPPEAASMSSSLEACILCA
jgi:hypothetical protein